MKHKHADLIKAWADGAKIQAISDDGTKWNDCNSAPNWNPFRTYRIKPEPKHDVVKYAGINLHGDGSWNLLEEVAYYVSHFPNFLKLTFDGETGKLKSAEVLK